MSYKHLLYLVLSTTIFSCKSINIKEKEPPLAKNVILLIGDGTGLSQISSAFYFKKTPTNYKRFKHIGLIKTSSIRKDITDSAAGATSFSAGIKTYNKAIGVADDSTHVQNIVEIASLQKIKTGVISTSSIQHATPASFYAHVINRNLYEDISKDMVSSEIDFFAGGGTDFFNKRKDSKNLLAELKIKGFEIDTTSLGSFSDIKANSKMGYLLANNHMKSINNGRGDFLPKATELGLQFLSKDTNNPNFFVMIEGSQIDWGGHANDAKYVISELIDFDDAIGKALDFAEKDGNTLVIVTGDHETGGFTLSSNTEKKQKGKSGKEYSQLMGTFSTKGHSATLIPVFAYGPGAEKFAGIYENTEIFYKILEATKWDKSK
ncbi:alkaline phosphatase [uncultured Polaribacter sp.]|uniref:alkaline phosphatase n=1 Tax=uncultured Polaribacter sp. TaxID=174711 RepID=UPI0026045FBD|nr:alkaline phosphatase [uncultured Polaribacter sp.]